MVWYVCLFWSKKLRYFMNYSIKKALFDALKNRLLNQGDNDVIIEFCEVAKLKLSEVFKKSLLLIETK